MALKKPTPPAIIGSGQDPDGGALVLSVDEHGAQVVTQSDQRTVPCLLRDLVAELRLNNLYLSRIVGEELTLRDFKD